MSWTVVRQELMLNVVPLMADHVKGEQWVELLGQTQDGQRLGACAVIDFRYGSVTPDVFASILNYLDFSKEEAQRDACWAFNDAISNHPDTQRAGGVSPFSCSSCFTGGDGESVVYVRIMDLGTFIAHVLNSNDQPMSALSPDDRARAVRMYFTDEDEPWEEIDKMWTGSMGRVFVAPLDDLLNLLADAADPGNIVNDALGLGMKGNLEFVAVKYPAGFCASYHQPTALDANWSGGNWYISHRNVDSWGRTHRCSGQGAHARERVHLKADIICAGFSGKYIGRPVAAVTEDRDGLLNEAFARL